MGRLAPQRAEAQGRQIAGARVDLRDIKKMFFDFFGMLPFNFPFLERMITKDVEFAHMHYSPKSIANFAVLTSFLLVLLLFPIFYFLNITLFIPLFIVFFYFYYIITYPSYKASLVAMQMQNELLLSVLYTAVHLRLYRTMEGAVNFASRRSGTLGEEFKKIVWELKTGMQHNVNSSIAALSKKLGMIGEGFGGIMDMLHSSLMEGDQTKFEETIDKAVDIQIESSFNNMRSYAETLSNPIKLIFMLLIMLPMLLLVILPIVGIFLKGEIPFIFLVATFNIFIPFFALYYSVRMLSKRPGVFPIDISKHPKLSKAGVDIFGFSIDPFYPAIFLGLLLAFYGLIDLPSFFILSDNYVEGLLKSIFITLGIAAAVASYFYLSSYQKTQIREDIKKMEREFRVGLRELAVLLRKNIPLENALLILSTRNSSSDNQTFQFFKETVTKMRLEGKSIKETIFGKNGTIHNYPSKLIEDIMELIVESVDRGPKQASLAVSKISHYLDKVAEINNTISSLFSELLSTISLLSVFIVPLIGAITASLGSLLVSFLFIIVLRIANFAGIAGFDSTVLLPFNPKESISPPLLQLIVGIYVIEMIVVLSVLQDGLENGYDPVSRNMKIAKQVALGFFAYLIMLFASLILLNMLSSNIFI